MKNEIKNQDVANLYLSGKNMRASKKIYELFYTDEPKIFLSRKKEKFDDILKKQTP